MNKLKVGFGRVNTDPHGDGVGGYETCSSACKAGIAELLIAEGARVPDDMRA